MMDWAIVLAEYGQRVWRTTYRILNHSEDANECYQETFLAALQMDHNRSITEWEPILICLATRKAIDRLRKNLRENRRTPALDSIPETAGITIEPLQGIMMNELLDHLRLVLTEIPSKQATVVWLSCVEELENNQIANHLKISVGEVRVLLHRGRSKLQELMEFIISPIEEKT